MDGLPGSLTVPPLHGWGGIVVLLLAAVVIGVAFLLVGAGRPGPTRSAEWQDWLEARSRARHPDDESVPPAR